MTTPLRTAAQALLDKMDTDGTHYFDRYRAALRRALSTAQDERAEGFREGVEAARSAMWMESGRSMLGDEVLKRADARIRRLTPPTPEPERPAPVRCTCYPGHPEGHWAGCPALRALASPPTTDEAKESK